MTPTTTESNSKARAAVAGRMAEARHQAERVSQEARRIATRASDVVDDRVQAARRAARKAQLRAVDVRDEMGYRIKRQPFAAVALAAGGGLLLALALVGMRRCQHAARARADNG